MISGPSAVREAFVLPLLFLTVAAAGGLRLGADGVSLSFVPPPLMGDHRSALENMSGAVVLLTLFAASAQLFTCLTPDAGILRLLFNLFFVFLLWNTLAAQPDRVRLLRSLVVVFGWAYVVRYIALAALADPQGGWMRRMVTALLEGASAPGVAGEPMAPVAGYIAFATIGLYMIGLVLLPRVRAGESVAIVTRAPDALE